MKDFSLINLLKNLGKKQAAIDLYPEVAEHPSQLGLDVLVLADTHRTLNAGLLTPNLEPLPDMVLMLGDVNYGDLQLLFGGGFIPKEVPIYAIFGNHDPKDLFSFFPRVHVLKEGEIEQVTIKDKTFTMAGLYGSIRYKNSEHYIMHSHKESVDLLDPLPVVDLLITHSNPEFDKPEDDQYDHLCTNAHSGLYGIGKYIDEKQPALVLFGHLHKPSIHKRNNTYVRCCYLVERFMI